MQNLKMLFKPTIEKCLLVAVYVIAVFLLLQAILNKGYNAKIGFQNLNVVRDNWVNAETGMMLSKMDNKIELAPGESVTIKRDFTRRELLEDCLIIYNPVLHLTVTLDGVDIYDNGESEHLERGNEVGAIWEVIDIPKSITNTEITLKFINYGKPGSAVRTIDTHNIIIGDRNDIARYLFVDNLRDLLIEVFFIFAGVFLVIYSIILVYYKDDGSSKIILYLGLLTLSCSFWAVTDSSVKQLIYNNVTFNFLVNYICLYLLPLFMMLFFRELLDIGKRLVSVVIKLYSTLLIVLFMLYEFNIVHFRNSITVMHVAVFLCVITFGVLSFLNFMKNKGGKAGVILSGFIILYAACLVGLVFYYFGNAPLASNLFKYSVYVFLLILFFTVVRDSLKHFKNFMAVDHYKKLAYVDKVTEGNSKGRFEEKLEAVRLEAPEKYWLVHLNFINFKFVNEAMSWEKGNALLKNIYSANESLLGPNDMQCNLGSASFAYLLECEDDYEKLHDMCVKLKQSTIRVINVSGLSMNLNIVLSVCRVSEGGNTLSSILDKAIIARGNKLAQYWEDALCYVYNEECTKKILQDKKLEGRLDEALFRHEFEMYLQPKVNPLYNKVEGAEALVRWNAPDGRIFPDQFIPLFEKNGSISKIDLYMFRCACELIQKWIAEGTEPIIISVNVSKTRIENAQFLQNYERILNETGAPGKYLELEFTESIAYHNCDTLGDVIEWIHDHDMRCSMDDFGSAYSNFNGLLKLDFDTIKMDKAFFDSYPESGKSRLLVRDIIQVFQSLGMDVVSEGIERIEQVDALKEMDCNLIQGYYYSKPIPVSEFEEKFMYTDNI